MAVLRYFSDCLDEVAWPSFSLRDCLDRKVAWAILQYFSDCLDATARRLALPRPRE